MRALAPLAVALACCAPAPAPVTLARPAVATHALRCGRAWDPDRGLVADARIVLDGDRIASFGPASASPAASDEIDLRPLTCLPGLVDAHTHLTSYARELATDGLDKRRAEAAKNARLTLEAGVTSVRDLGGAEGVDLWLRDRVHAGALPGPRMQVAGSQIGAEGSVGGPRSARGAVDAHVEAGFDVIKLFATGGASNPVPLMTAPEIAAAADEAHGRGLKVAVHAITTAGIDASIAAGVDSIEHAPELSVDEARAMAAAGIVLVPTLYILRYYVEDADRLGFPEERVEGLKRLIAERVGPFEARFRDVLATGVKVAMGSDAFMALHGRNARELRHMVAAGMTPEQALRAATATSASLLGWTGRVGTLRPGAYADVIAVAGDPLRDPTALESVAVVIAGGKVVRDGRR